MRHIDKIGVGLIIVMVVSFVYCGYSEKTSPEAYRITCGKILSAQAFGGTSEGITIQTERYTITANRQVSFIPIGEEAFISVRESGSEYFGWESSKRLYKISQ